MFFRRASVFLIVLGATRQAHAYQWPLLQHVVNATVGEYRDTITSNCPSISGGPCPHFHDGVDLGGFQWEAVTAVTDGVVKQGNANPGLVREIADTGGIFDYIHVDPIKALSDATANRDVPVFADPTASSNLIALIDYNPPHVHLRELDAAGANVLNNLSSPDGLTPYGDNSWPQVWDVELFDANAPGGQPLGPVIPKDVTALDIRAQAKDPQDFGSQNAGVYQIGYQIFDAGTGRLVQSGDHFPRQSYDSIPVGQLQTPYLAYDTTLSHGSNGYFQYFYFASNALSAETPLDLGQLPDGNYNVCVLAKDIKGNGGDVSGQRGAACVNLILARTPPVLTITDGSGNTLNSGDATSDTWIDIEAAPSVASVPIQSLAVYGHGDINHGERV